MDFNDFLRNTKTAAEEDRGVVKVPAVGRKRSADTTDSPLSTSSDAPKLVRARRSGTAEGLNLQAAQDALAQERGSSSAHAQQQLAQADLLSEQAAARMVHRVMDYVLQAELGGQHNAAKGGAAPYVPPAAQLAAEKARWTAAAGYTIHHVVPASAEASTTLESMVSVAERERVPEGVRLLRSSLQLCDAERDLVGGIRSGMAPRLRTHVLEVLERGLRGQAWVRDDHSIAAQFAALGKSTTPEKGPSSVLLFRNSPSTASEQALQEASSAAAEAPAASSSPAGESGGFSLAAFLNEQEASSSPDSSDSDGDAPA